MSNLLLNSGHIGNIETNLMRKVRNEINERWEKLGFLQNLNGPMKDAIATLFENQAKVLMTESTTADSSGSFETVVFPLIRRSFSRLIAHEIVSVQAMNLATGRIFFFRPETSERLWNIAGNDIRNAKNGDFGRHSGVMGYNRVDHNHYENKPGSNGEPTVTQRFNIPDEAILPNKDAKLNDLLVKSLYDAFYNDGLFDNSKGRATLRKVEGDDLKPVVITSTGFKEITFADIKPTDGGESIHRFIVEVQGFSSTSPGKLTGPNGNEMDTETFLSSLRILTTDKIDGGDKFASYEAFESLPAHLVAQEWGSGIVKYGPNICNANGKVYLEIVCEKPIRRAGETFDGFIGLDPAVVNGGLNLFGVWLQYDSLEYETEMAEVSFTLSSVTITAESRKLRATWSPELAQDVSAFHNVDAEAELTSLLSEQVSGEIDREILRDLRTGSAWTFSWDYNGWKRMPNVVSTGDNQKRHNQMLITTINQISAQIHKSTLRGSNELTLVVSTEIGALFNDLQYFHVTDASAGNETYSMGVKDLGRLQGRYRVIVDPYAPHFSLLVTSKGESLFDTGYVYAPYVPLTLTPTLTHTTNFTPVKGIMTRYAKKMLNNRYYGHIVVHGLPSFDVNLLR